MGEYLSQFIIKNEKSKGEYLSQFIIKNEKSKKNEKE